MNLTPDLSRSFHPVPKPAVKAKKTPKPLGAGKKTNEWKEERGVLKEEFEKLGITKCEIGLPGCARDNFLGFAHLDKRRNLTIEDLPKVVLACNPCHDEVELLNRVRMGKILTEIIKNRKA